MVKRKLNPLEDSPTASSSDEDEVEAVSGEDEEDVEEQISDDSSSEEEDDLMDPVIIPPVTKPKSLSAAATIAVPGGYTVASGSEASPSKPGSKKPIADTVAKSNEKEVRGSPAVKSVKKRPIEQASLKEVNAKRSKKVSEDSEKKIAEEKKKPLFQRLWSEEDEISLLQGMIDYKADTGDSPYEDMDKFYEFTRKSIVFEASKSQFVDKIRSLKKKYMGKVTKGVESLPKAHDMECLKLSKYIWGSHGMALKSVVKSNVKKSEKKLDTVKPHGKEVEEVESDGMPVESAVKFNGTLKTSEKKLDYVEANGEKVEEDREVLIDGKKVVEDKQGLVNGGESKCLGVMGASDWFEDSFLVGSISSLGVSEQFVKQKWSMVAVETKKRMEEKWKLLQAKEMELVLQKTDFMREVGSVIAEAS